MLKGNDGVNGTVQLCSGTRLYRIVRFTETIQKRTQGSVEWRGVFHATRSRTRGRFSQPDQSALYSGTNVLVCLGEVLFHMYKRTLEKIRLQRSFTEVGNSVQNQALLIVATMPEIRNLLFLESEEAKVLDGRVAGSTTVYPEKFYEPFDKIANRARSDGYRGIVYPSARHSEGFCVVLFRGLRPTDCAYVKVTLRLLCEEQELWNCRLPFHPMNKKLHPTMGEFEFEPAPFEKLRLRGVFEPHSLARKGMIDFVRRKYRWYPADAVWSCARAAGEGF